MDNNGGSPSLIVTSNITFGIVLMILAGLVAFLFYKTRGMNEMIDDLRSRISTMEKRNFSLNNNQDQQLVASNNAPGAQNNQQQSNQPNFIQRLLPDFMKPNNNNNSSTNINNIPNYTQTTNNTIPNNNARIPNNNSCAPNNLQPFKPNANVVNSIAAAAASTNTNIANTDTNIVNPSNNQIVPPNMNASLGNNSEILEMYKKMPRPDETRKPQVPTKFMDKQQVLANNSNSSEIPTAFADIQASLSQALNIPTFFNEPMMRQFLCPMFPEVPSDIAVVQMLISDNCGTAAPAGMNNSFENHKCDILKDDGICKIEEISSEESINTESNNSNNEVTDTIDTNSNINNVANNNGNITNNTTTADDASFNNDNASFNNDNASFNNDNASFNNDNASFNNDTALCELLMKSATIENESDLVPELIDNTVVTNRISSGRQRNRTRAKQPKNKQSTTSATIREPLLASLEQSLLPEQ